MTNLSAKCYYNIPILKSFLLHIAVILLLCATCYSQPDGKFGCGEERSDFFEHPDLSFVQLSTPDAIRDWQARPVLKFGGFDQGRYGFSEVQFYRWHVLVPERKDMDQSSHHDSTDRLALAVHLVGGSGERWFELANPAAGQRGELLYMQPDAGNQSDASDDPTATPAPGAKAKKQTPQSIEKWLALQPATADATLPLFVLRYSYNDSGANAEGTIDNELLLDLRSGTPQFAKAAQCIHWEGGGACTSPDTSNATWDRLACQWEQAAGDFHCKMISGFGAGDYPARTAQRQFYLLSNKPAKPDWYSADLPADLAALAQRIHNDPKAATQRVLVPGLGPTTMLARYSDLAPNTDVMIFGSPGPGTMYDARLWFVSVPASPQGTAVAPTVQPIAKWSIGSDDADEAASTDLAAYTPVEAPDKYTVAPLEQKPGFHAVQAVLIIPPPAGAPKDRPQHVVFWIGVEAANGEFITNAVRLASETTEYAHCEQNLHDGTATSIQPKKGIAEATVHVQPKELPVESGDKPPCAWTGVLHWKPATGFRVRKIDDDCESPVLTVKITDAGAISAKKAKQ